MKTGGRNPGKSAGSNTVSASMPPADAPMTTASMRPARFKAQAAFERFVLPAQNPKRRPLARRNAVILQRLVEHGSVIGSGIVVRQRGASAGLMMIGREARDPPYAVHSRRR